MTVFVPVPWWVTQVPHIRVEGGEKICSAIFRKLKQLVSCSQQKNAFASGGKVLAADLSPRVRALPRWGWEAALQNGSSGTRADKGRACEGLGSLWCLTQDSADTFPDPPSNPAFNYLA